jgi:hypothetical protein
MIYTCNQCRKEFEPPPGHRAQPLFCSQACYHDSIRVVDLHKLRTLVEFGVGKTHMSRALGVNRSTIRRLIEHHGLEKLWRQRRYHGDGVESAITAFDPKTECGPFAKSA